MPPLRIALATLLSALYVSLVLTELVGPSAASLATNWQLVNQAGIVALLAFLIGLLVQRYWCVGLSLAWLVMMLRFSEAQDGSTVDVLVEFVGFMVTASAGAFVAGVAVTRGRARRGHPLADDG